VGEGNAPPELVFLQGVDAGPASPPIRRGAGCGGDVFDHSSDGPAERAHAFRELARVIRPQRGGLLLAFHVSSAEFEAGDCQRPHRVVRATRSKTERILSGGPTLVGAELTQAGFVSHKVRPSACRFQDVEYPSRRCLPCSPSVARTPLEVEWRCCEKTNFRRPDGRCETRGYAAIGLAVITRSQHHRVIRFGKR